MITEETKLKIVKVFGYTPEELNCANADTAMSEIYDNGCFDDAMSCIQLFITNCSVEEFKELKEILIEQIG
jgi:hypothetical protein